MAYAETKIGSERIKGAYAWQTILKNGGRIGALAPTPPPSPTGADSLLIALGSDFPIESIDPLKGFYSAITRLDQEGNSPHGPGGWFASPSGALKMVRADEMLP